MRLQRLPVLVLPVHWVDVVVLFWSVVVLVFVLVLLGAMPRLVFCVDSWVTPLAGLHTKQAL